MKIKQRISTHRRDFEAIYVCQHCGHEEKGTGYDDEYFHSSVIPDMECKKCGKTGKEQTSTPSIPAHVVM